MKTNVREDRQIVELYLERNESAISQSRIKYGAYILAIAFNILGSKEDAAECENDTYLSAWNSIPPKTPANLKLFLGRIARNISIDLYRKNNTKKRGEGMEGLLSELAECVPDKNGIEAEIDMHRLTDTINEFLRFQAKEKRVMFVKRYWYGQSVSDIAKSMGASESKVSTTLFRVRADLKEWLFKEGYRYE